MKLRSLFQFDALRQRLVLTFEEKRVIVFILIALVLGLATKHYRETHSLPPRIDQKHSSHPERRPLPVPSPPAQAPPH